MTDLLCVDLQDQPVGTMEKVAAHAPPGHLHRAFSVMLFDDAGQCLLQRRAASKYHFAGLWANTCCGHPGPGQDVAEAAARRTFEELGVRPGALRTAGSFVYQAQDPASGLIEYEYDHVLLGRLDVHLDHIDPDPDEVDEIRLISLDDLDDELIRHPEHFTPWLGGVVRLARHATSRTSPTPG